MHKRLYLVLCFVACLAWPAFAQQDDGFYWLSSYREALRQAKQSGKPIFLEYRCEP